MHAKKEEFRQFIESNQRNLNRLPDIEQKLYHLYLEKDFSQKDVSILLGMTQGGVSSRLKRMEARLMFLNKLESFDLEGLDASLRTLFGPFDMELLKGMLRTTCQSETADSLNSLFNLSSKRGIGSKTPPAMTQVKVKYRFEKCLELMKKNSSAYYELFLLIENNLYILHEVNLPHFNKR